MPIPKLSAPTLPRLSAPQISAPNPRGALKSIGQAAGEVAERSHRVGEVASEIQKASDAIEKGSKR